MTLRSCAGTAKRTTINPTLLVCVDPVKANHILGVIADRFRPKNPGRHIRGFLLSVAQDG